MTKSNKSEIGHNSGEVSGARLKSFVERIERLESEKKSLGEDIKDVYAELKSAGYEPKITKRLVSERRKELQKRKEDAELLSLYASAIQFDLGF